MSTFRKSAFAFVMVSLMAVVMSGCSTEKQKNQAKEAALVRVEQLYPLNLDAIQKVVEGFSSAAKLIWCQEEPRNMGAWTYISPLLQNGLGREIHYAGRPAAASPAVGAKALHDQRQKDLVHQAYSL